MKNFFLHWCLFWITHNIIYISLQRYYMTIMLFQNTSLSAVCSKVCSHSKNIKVPNHWPFARGILSWLCFPSQNPSDVESLSMSRHHNFEPEFSVKASGSKHTIPACMTDAHIIHHHFLCMESDLGKWTVVYGIIQGTCWKNTGFISTKTLSATYYCFWAVITVMSH